MLSDQHLRFGLQGYLILFTPRTFVSECQYWPSRAPSPLVFLRLSTHFTATVRIPSASTKLKLESFCCCYKVKPCALTTDFYEPPTDALRPVIPDNTRNLRMTAAAGTKLAVSYSLGTVRTSSLRKGVDNPQTFILHAVLLRQACAHCGKCLTAASLRSQGRISVPVCPNTLSGRISIVALVMPLPHQLANRKQAHLLATSFSLLSLWGISHRFQWLFPSRRQILTCYSPVRH